MPSVTAAREHLVLTISEPASTMPVTVSSTSSHGGGTTPNELPILNPSEVSEGQPSSSQMPSAGSSSASGGDNEGDFLRNILSQLWKKMYGIIPFALLFCAKVLHDHSIGLLVLIGLTGTFVHADMLLKNCISQRTLRREVILKLVWIMCFLSGSTFFLYYVFEDQQLYRSLYFCLPNLPNFDAWNLFWCILITDYVLKYITVCVKAVVAMIPKSMMAYKKKGSVYFLIEQISQTYRLFPPTAAWIMFLTDNQTSGKDWYNALMVILYIVFKSFLVWKSLKSARDAWKRFSVDVTYGIKPSSESLQTSGDICPICHEAFTDPIQLQCKHIFCDECVIQWFDRERTCPMCRAKVVEDPAWRDGATTGLLQVY